MMKIITGDERIAKIGWTKSVLLMMAIPCTWKVPGCGRGSMSILRYEKDRWALKVEIPNEDVRGRIGMDLDECAQTFVDVWDVIGWDEVPTGYQKAMHLATIADLQQQRAA